MNEIKEQMFVIWIWIYCDICIDIDLFLDYIARV